MPKTRAVGEYAAPNDELTTQERNVLSLWKRHLKEHGAPPSLRAAASELGVFPNTVRYATQRLATRGYMRAEKVTVVGTRLTLSDKGKRAV
jgi:Mn-dependent DtxR family transcriptional regulator